MGQIPECSGLQVWRIDNGEFDMDETVPKYDHTRRLNDDEVLKEMSGEENMEYWIRVGGGYRRNA